MFRDCAIGDRVFDYLKQEWGKITDIIMDEDYPIKVKFPLLSVKYSYTIDGKPHEFYKVPTLFWAEVKPMIPPRKPLPKLKVDTKVVVWDEDNIKHNRYFSHFNLDGNIVCFSGGRTSWSATNDTSYWKHWEIVKEKD